MAAVEQAMLDGADLVEFCWDQPLSATGVAEGGQTLSTLVATTRGRYRELVVGVTTARPEVARQVCDAGAHLLRGIHGQDNSAVRDVAAEHDAAFVVVRSGGVGAEHSDALVDAVIRDLTCNAESAVARGIPTNGVLIDPGLDTVTNPGAARTMLGRLDELAATGWPVVASLSVAGLFSGALDAQGLQDRASLVTPTVLALLGGAVVFRTHDVATTRRALETGALSLE
jgi:dihydropteroate synthase